MKEEFVWNNRGKIPNSRRFLWETFIFKTRFESGLYVSFDPNNISKVNFENQMI